MKVRTTKNSCVIIFGAVSGPNDERGTQRARTKAGDNEILTLSNTSEYQTCEQVRSAVDMGPSMVSSTTEKVAFQGGNLKNFN